MALTTQQKNTVAQFVALTGAGDKIAQRFLKNANYKLEVAVDQYYSSNQAVQSSSRSDAALEKMFDDMRDPNEDHDKDTIGVDSMMNYLTTLEVNPESCEIFVVLEIVRAASFGQITRKGFVDGWKLTGVTPSIPSHKQYIRNCVSQLSRDPAYFKKVYRHTFIAGKEPDQKALSVENALVYWEMMFNPPGRPWATNRTDWFAAWKTFLDANWKRSVNRDMWNQTLEFANKTLEDEELTFWTEDAAWPSVIDQFVVWCRAEGILAAGGTDGMEVE